MITNQTGIVDDSNNKAVIAVDVDVDLIKQNPNEDTSQEENQEVLLRSIMNKTN